VLSEAINFTTQPVRPLAVPAFTVLALLWFEVSEVLEHNDRRTILAGKFDDVAADPMRRVVVDRADVAEPFGVVARVIAGHTGLR
jgi:hypothetical protein